MRFVGVSINDHQPDSALDLIRTGLIDTVQVIYNIFDQSPEARLFPLAKELGIGVLARVPLDEGALTGTIDGADDVFEPGDFRERYFRGRPEEAGGGARGRADRRIWQVSTGRCRRSRCGSACRTWPCRR